MESSAPSSACPGCGSALEASGLCARCLMAGAAEPTEPSTTCGGHDLELVAAAFPHLEILELIGRGGMGTVFKVRQPKLNRFAALKLLPHSLAADPAFAGRFEREAQVLARLSHPNIVAVYDYGQADGFFYLLMEFVDGVNLRQAMRAARFTPEQALGIVPKICEALQFAHDEGVLHRDIKPENLLLDSRGRVKLADFGIAKLAAEAEVAGLGEGSQDPLFTQSGTALGTPSYMAPEQRESPSEVDHRADIYSLGVVFYEMLTGELPGPDFVAPSSKSAADSRVDEIVKQALEQDPRWRQHSAEKMKTQVEAVTGLTPEKRGGIEAARDIFSRAAIVFSVAGTWKQWEIVAPGSEAEVPVTVTGIGLGEPWLTEHRWLAAEPGQPLGTVGAFSMSPELWLLSEVAMVLAAICWTLWFGLKYLAGERWDSTLDGSVRLRFKRWRNPVEPLVACFALVGAALDAARLWLGAAPFCLWLVFSLVGLSMAFAAPQGSTASILPLSLAQLYTVGWVSAAIWSSACAARRRWAKHDQILPAPGPWPYRAVGMLCGIILIAFAGKIGFFKDEIDFFKALF